MFSDIEIYDFHPTKYFHVRWKSSNLYIPYIFYKCSAIHDCIIIQPKFVGYTPTDCGSRSRRPFTGQVVFTVFPQGQVRHVNQPASMFRRLTRPSCRSADPSRRSPCTRQPLPVAVARPTRWASESSSLNLDVCMIEFVSIDGFQLQLWNCSNCIQSMQAGTIPILWISDWNEEFRIPTNPPHTLRTYINPLKSTSMTL